jgi:hypothetical protein
MMDRANVLSNRPPVDEGPDKNSRIDGVKGLEHTIYLRAVSPKPLEDVCFCV